MPFTAAELKKHFFPELLAAEQAPPPVKQTLTGPAQINGWNLIEGRAAFIQPEVIDPSSKPG